MIRRVIAFLFVMMLFGASNAASSASVTVDVTTVRNNHGTVMIAVCDSDSFLKAVCPYYSRIDAAKGLVRLSIPNIAPGVYAIQVIHDENNNAKFDSNAIGIPKEGYGFSKNPHSPFGPPAFDATSITIDQGDITLPVRLRYIFD